MSREKTERKPLGEKGKGITPLYCFVDSSGGGGGGGGVAVVPPQRRCDRQTNQTEQTEGATKRKGSPPTRTKNTYFMRMLNN